MAWESLFERYNNKRLLIYNHLQSLFEHQLRQRESAMALRDLLDTISKYLHSLNTLHLDAFGWDV